MSSFQKIILRAGIHNNLASVLKKPFFSRNILQEMKRMFSGRRGERIYTKINYVNTNTKEKYIYIYIGMSK